jgi:glycosyltransferase involved in cell wall biosynthesis
MAIPKYVGGAERRLARIFNAIAKERTDVDLIALSTSEHIGEFSQDILQKVNFRKIYVIDDSHLKGRIKVYKHLISKRYKVAVYFGGSLFHFGLNVLAHITGMKTIITVASSDSAYNRMTGKRKYIDDLSIKTASHVDCLYPMAEKGMKERFPRKNITITPKPYTDVTKYVPRKKENIVLFAAARLEKGKNPHLLLNAVNIIQKEIRNKDYKVIICGNRYEEETLKRISESNGTGDIVHFVGNVDIKDYASRAEVFFSLQLVENYPSQALQEAISCGCYIIATDVGSTRSIADGITFSKLVKNDEHELANAILGYFEFSQIEKEERSKFARKFAESNFMLEPNKLYFTNIIDSLLCNSK